MGEAMEYQVRKAETSDLSEILAIYEGARAFMRQHGNPNQWGNSTPEPASVEKNIGDGDLYVLENGQRIHGVFFFKIFADPTYEKIYDGAWKSSEPYGVLHRVAGDGSGGILKAAAAFARQKIQHLRIDTHAENIPMQGAILKQGFSYCGIIHTEKGDPRLAYERLK